MENFTPLPATIGGILIGLAATTMLVTQGRIAGISGIMGGMLDQNTSQKFWRYLFFLGLIIGASSYEFFGGDVSGININPYNMNDTFHLIALIVGGLLVGLGTQIGSGCTSGHGVCGLGRFSRRSLVATIVFMGTAGLTVFAISNVFGV
jgi:uncharacterized membrane protein YedE/YeeE